MSTIEAKQNEIHGNKFSIYKGLCHSRKSNPRFGVLLVIAGLSWIGVKIDFIPVGWFHSEFFWPVIVVLAGSWITTNSLIKK
ncbi:MAG: hypothetical protein A2277_02900 [Desulfobacterales bacterium RIFOXYA12_FULL_46_15]|nr:MAG: hypothetical protein A2277_02900 [Desulfobacterales bacterium RIFOXYA12_FULL_46_15]